MNEAKEKIIGTIGHSTRMAKHFIEMLQSFSIEVVVDIRTYPGSNRYPHFNKENLEAYLPENNIEYIHLKSLGGRRLPKPDSKNTSWKNAGFRGYADYMESTEFISTIQHLEDIAMMQHTAYMCSEALWWRCHRSLVSDYLKLNGWKVFHIMDVEKSTEHTYTSPAKIIDGKLTYGENTLL